MKDQTIIRVKDLTYTYPDGEKPVLYNVSLTVREGEFIGIMGPTGAGKSTLCRCLSGLIPHSIGGKLEGEVIIGEAATTEQSLKDIVKRVGICFQDPEVQLFGMDVEEDVSFKPENLGFSPEKVQEMVKWALHQVRLDGFEMRFPYTLSGGQKQRLAIASVLSAQPEILILDEPTSELDPIGKTEVFDVLNKLHEDRRRTIIVVEHNCEELARVAERIIVMNEGRIVLEGEPNYVFRQVDLFDKLGVRVPQISRLGHLLMKNKVSGWEMYNFPISIEDAERRLREIFKKKGIPPSKRKIEKKRLDENRKPIVEIRNLTHIYGKGTEEEVIALDNINLKIYENDFIALIGQNGSGKTTLAKHIKGILKPTSGTVIVKGLDTKKTSLNELSAIVGYSYQNPDNQIFNLTVEDEIAFGPGNLFLSEEEIKNRVREALETVGLIGYEKRNPFFLTKDERQKVAVASILAMHPDILIIDEPSTGMDWKTSKSMMELTKRLHEKGRTVIFITHDMHLVTQYAKRVIVLKKGKVLLDGPTEWVFSQVEKLREAFITPPQIGLLSYLLKDYLGSSLLTVEEGFKIIKEVMMN